MSGIKVKKYLEVLGLQDNASLQELKKAYRIKAKQFHPDAADSMHAERFVEINKAYEYLLALRKTSLTLPFSQLVYTAPKPITPVANPKRTAPPIVKISTGKILLELIKTPTFKAIFLSLINFLLLLNIGFRTLLSPMELLLLFGIPSVLVFVTFWIFRKTKNYFFSAIYTPVVVNAFLLLNFVFSNHPVQENYNFEEKMILVKSFSPYHNDDSDSIIELENNIYQDYPGIRFFFDIRELLYKNHISYTFKTGLFGLKVMTHYELMRK